MQYEQNHSPEALVLWDHLLETPQPWSVQNIISLYRKLGLSSKYYPEIEYFLTLYTLFGEYFGIPDEERVMWDVQSANWNDGKSENPARCIEQYKPTKGRKGYGEDLLVEGLDALKQAQDMNQVITYYTYPQIKACLPERIHLFFIADPRGDLFLAEKRGYLPNGMRDFLSYYPNTQAYYNPKTFWIAIQAIPDYSDYYGPSTNSCAYYLRERINQLLEKFQK